MLHHRAGISKHSRKTRVGRNQDSPLYQAIMGTSTKLATQDPQYLPMQLQEDAPSLCNQYLGLAFPLTLFRCGNRKITLILSFPRDISPNLVHRYSYIPPPPCITHRLHTTRLQQDLQLHRASLDARLFARSQIL